MTAGTDSPLHHLPLSEWRPRSQLRVPETPRTRFAGPVIDAHNHLGRWLSKDWMVPDVGALLELMDRWGIVAVVNLDGRWGDELTANLDRYDHAHPGRFVTCCHLDWSVLSGPAAHDAPALLVQQVEAAAAAGARGVKVWKDLGLHVRDAAGDLVRPDDHRLSDAFDAMGAAGLPVVIHTADPVAFFAPLDEHNERLDELGRVPSWWFGDRDRFPSFERLFEAYEGLVAAHPGTTFVGAHVGNLGEDLGQVGRMLATYPNLHVDLGARLGEIGRQPRAFRRLVEAHPDRVLFGTDSFPLVEEELALYARFLETADEHFPYAPGEVMPQGRWMIAGCELPPALLAAVYHDNAARVFSLP